MVAWCSYAWLGNQAHADEGVVRFTLPTSPRGVVVEDVTLEFREGRVVGARAERGDAYLQATLDSDPGARYLGELGIGTNFGIDRPIGVFPRRPQSGKSRGPSRPRLRRRCGRPASTRSKWPRG